MEEEYFTIDEIAERLKVTRKTVYDWMRSGQLAYVQVGSRRRITRSALSTFIRAGQPEEVDEAEEIDSPALMQLRHMIRNRATLGKVGPF